ncbi:ribosome small subunit-dependent GTPase A [candidate division KSB1 bacterium]|nr:MAG: ribosome small subunit-dependent GTPase A [candidate division KSB1 bacterium]
MEGTIIQKHRRKYTVDSNGNYYSCILRGRLFRDFKRNKNLAVVGDEVLFEVINNNEGVITEIKERKNKLSRLSAGRPDLEQVIAANIDQLVIVSSSKEPDFKPGLVDRFIAAGEKGELEILICINKMDLIDSGEIEKYVNLYRKIGYRIVLTSAVSGTGLESLKKEMMGKKSIFVGQSGVGKSTIINTLQPGLNIDVNEVSSKTGKGVHTTTSVSLYRLDFGAYVMDTPGIREFSLWDIDKKSLHYYFKEFRKYINGCKYSDCVHINEPDCQIIEALKKGEIPLERYKSYRNIYSSL